MSGSGRPADGADSEDAVPFDSGTSDATDDQAPTQTCERCGQGMYDRHCKVICPNCGYLRDCSDP